MSDAGEAFISNRVFGFDASHEGVTEKCLLNEYRLMCVSLFRRLRSIDDFWDTELEIPAGKQLLEDLQFFKGKSDELSEKLYGTITVSSGSSPENILRIIKTCCGVLERVYITKKAENSSFTIVTFGEISELKKKVCQKFLSECVYANVRIKPLKFQSVRS